MKQYLLAVGAIVALSALGCASGETETEGGDGGSGGATTTTTTTTTSSGMGGMGGSGAMGGGGEGGGFGLCDMDCSAIDTPDCLQSVCNEGQYPGTVGSCVVVDQDDGTACEDGQFCTVNDSCVSGTCTAGPQNDCGILADQCEVVTCDENAKACNSTAGPDGSACTPGSLCEVNGMCTNGLCVGEQKDCFFAPVTDCEVGVCDQMTGMCVGEADPAKEGQGCVNGGDKCMVNKVCTMGLCEGGSPLDCSALDVGCQNGVCNAMNGMCEPQMVAVGGACNSGTDQCNSGVCDAMQQCILSPVMDGTVCDDFSTCTSGDVCTTGVCGGALDPNCSIYFEEKFEVCPPPGWSLNAEWECGTPTNVGPAAAFDGINVLGFDLDDNYENNNSYDVAFAQTPPIGLGTATAPKLRYYHYVNTEGSSYDGYNIKISTDNGNTFVNLMTVAPPYNLPSVGGEAAYGGDLSAQNWTEVQADLTAYVGQQVILRFAFRSDGSVQDPGVYLDDMIIGEGSDLPVSVTTPLTLKNGLATVPYSVTLGQTGGSGMATWSITGGTNHAWLSIDPNTGELTGTPTAAELGPVTVDVHLEEPSNPTNFDDATFNFIVQQVVYFDDLEAACPGNWTLAGDWQCGVPSSGPNAAVSGTQVIASNLAGTYNNNLAWAINTVSSGQIDLTMATAPELSFQVWYDTESQNLDGWNVKVSTDNGASYNLVTTVTPAYPGTANFEMCWGGNQSAAGWQEHKVDLSAYAGMMINLQFAMRTDGSVQDLGVYLDDIAIAD